MDKLNTQIFKIVFLPSESLSISMCVPSRSIVSDSSRPYGQQPTRLFFTMSFSGKNTGVGSRFLLQGIFPPRNWTCVSHASYTAGRFFTTVPPEKPTYFCIGLIISMCENYLRSAELSTANNQAPLK